MIAFMRARANASACTCVRACLHACTCWKLFCPYPSLHVLRTDCTMQLTIHTNTSDINPRYPSCRRLFIRSRTPLHPIWHVCAPPSRHRRDAILANMAHSSVALSSCCIFCCRIRRPARTSGPSLCGRHRRVGSFESTSALCVCVGGVF